MLSQHDTEIFSSIMGNLGRLTDVSFIRTILMEATGMRHTSVRKCLTEVFDSRHKTLNEIIQRIGFNVTHRTASVADNNLLRKILRSLQVFERTNMYLGDGTCCLKQEDIWTLFDMVDAWFMSHGGPDSMYGHIIIQNAFEFKKQIETCMGTSPHMNSSVARTMMLWSIKRYREKYHYMEDPYEPVVDFLNATLPDPPAPPIYPGMSNEELDNLIEDAINDFDQMD
jgi:hypothetical protein